MRNVLGAACVAIVLAAAAVGLASTSTAASGPPTVKVQGRQLVDAAGKPVQLRGVNRAVFESRCTYDDTGFNDGPVDQASVTAMKSWKINAVRVTLNDQCWLGVNDLPAGGNAAGYRSAVLAYIRLLRKNGLYVMPVVEVFGPDAQKATQIDYMPDKSHMPAFWRSLASALKADRGIIFDPVTEVAMADWNDPHPDPAGSGPAGCTAARSTRSTTRRPATRPPASSRSSRRSARPAPSSRSCSAASTTTPTSHSC